MGHTITEKILAYASHQREAYPGDYVVADVDWVMIHDSTGPLAIKGLADIGKPLYDREKTVVVFDHFYPAPNLDAAKLHQTSRKFILDNNLPHFHTDGVCHELLSEKYVSPGDVVVGADSHTCTSGALGAFTTGLGSTDISGVMATGKCWFRVPESMKINLMGRTLSGVYAKDVILRLAGLIGAEGADYKAMEFAGAYTTNASILERLTMCNMAVEMGGKNGIVEADEKALAFTGREGHLFKSDPHTRYEMTLSLDVSGFGPQVACPHTVDNIKPVEEVAGKAIDQAYIGTCTNGRLDDLEVTAVILKGRKVKRSVRLIVIPASIDIYLEAFDRGILQTIIAAGGVVSSPSCGPCIGRHNGVLAKGEVCISTQNRNFASRMGSPEAEIYLGCMYLSRVYQ